jgi:hypothetical protein
MPTKELDTDKIDEAGLALLSLGRHDGDRAWMSFDWDAMARLHQKGYITDPVSKARSVTFTEAGAREQSDSSNSCSADPPTNRYGNPRPCVQPETGFWIFSLRTLLSRQTNPSITGILRSPSELSHRVTHRNRHR